MLGLLGVVLGAIITYGLNLWTEYRQGKRAEQEHRRMSDAAVLAHLKPLLDDVMREFRKIAPGRHGPIYAGVTLPPTEDFFIAASRFWETHVQGWIIDDEVRKAIDALFNALNDFNRSTHLLDITKQFRQVDTRDQRKAYVEELKKHQSEQEDFLNQFAGLYDDLRRALAQYVGYHNLETFAATPCACPKPEDQ